LAVISMDPISSLEVATKHHLTLHNLLCAEFKCVVCANALSLSLVEKDIHWEPSMN